ncbi:MAG: hypothetical protein GTN69_12075, partial [Armatimonadetes bacterium]|nr:hypothetical protein [Armatimonadota bacterium]
MLESALQSGSLGRWSFLGAEPFLVFCSKGPKLTVSQSEQDYRTNANPFSLLRQLLTQYALERPPGAPPLIAGAVGYFGYDLCRFVERLPSLAIDDVRAADCYLGFYDTVVAIDHQEGRAFISSSGLPESEPRKRLRRAHERLEATKVCLQSCTPALRVAPPLSPAGTAVAASEPPGIPLPGGRGADLRSNFTPE